MEDLDKALSSAQQASSRDNEIARILKCNKYDHVAILEFEPASLDELEPLLKKTFRKKSLLIHPDKTDNQDAPTAFDRLKRAHDVLSVLKDSEVDTDKFLVAEKQKLVDIYHHVMTKTSDITSIKSQVAAILDEEAHQEQLENQLSRKKEAKAREEEEIHLQALKTKRENAANWENQRESRVANWRAFVGKVDKKKKKKKKVLA